MPRKGNIPKREVLPDPVYGSVVVAKLINSVMLDGKKGVAQKIVYDAFDKVKETTGEEPLEVFEKAMNNIMPVLEVKARRVGGANYQGYAHQLVGELPVEPHDVFMDYVVTND